MGLYAKRESFSSVLEAVSRTVSGSPFSATVDFRPQTWSTERETRDASVSFLIFLTHLSQLQLNDELVVHNERVHVFDDVGMIQRLQQLHLRGADKKGQTDRRAQRPRSVSQR